MMPVEHKEDIMQLDASDANRDKSGTRQPTGGTQLLEHFVTSM